MPWQPVAFGLTLVFFHVTEFMLACLFMREEVGWNSWLFSKEYCIAMACGIAEFYLEEWLLPRMKTMEVISIIGLAMVLIGELIRKTGMVTAASNFTHQIRHESHPDHELVTWGIYRYIRHPGYLGWVMWAVGSQVMLINPICTVGFLVMSLQFMRDRVRYEEYKLRQFFGERYERYAQATPTYIPFVQ